MDSLYVGRMRKIGIMPGGCSNFLIHEVRYDAAAAGSVNDGKEPAHCVTSRVARTAATIHLDTASSCPLVGSYVEVLLVSGLTRWEMPLCQ